MLSNFNVRRQNVTHLGLAVLLLLAFLSFSISRRRPAAPTRGRVTFNGNPLRSGSILFIPVEYGPTAQANLTADGEYVLTTYEQDDGAVIGRHQVMVIALAEDPGRRGSDPPLPASGDQSRDPLPMISVIPEHYGDHIRSGLTANVVAGENRFDFALTSELSPGQRQAAAHSHPR